MSKPKVTGRIGLAMSAGGYRAGLFHLGSLWRLNELGNWGYALTDARIRRWVLDPNEEDRPGQLPFPDRLVPVASYAS